MKSDSIFNERYDYRICSSHDPNAASFYIDALEAYVKKHYPGVKFLFMSSDTLHSNPNYRWIEWKLDSGITDENVLFSLTYDANDISNEFNYYLKSRDKGYK